MEKDERTIKMLQPVLARSGSDKNNFIIEKIKQTLSFENKKALVLVPEQMSFETEKRLYLDLSEKLFSRVDVLSFTRLCELIGEKYGKSGLQRLSSAGKMILTADAASNCAGSLSVYQNQIESAVFVSQISAVIDQFKNAGISPDKLSESLESFDKNDGVFKKLSDVLKIYREYDKNLEDSFLDPSDSLLIACEKIRGKGFFENYDIFIDGFSSFNDSQSKLVEKMLSESQNVFVFLSFSDGFKICPASFKAPYDTLLKLKTTCKDIGVEIKENVTLNPCELTKNDGIKQIESFLAGETKSGKIEDVKIAAAFGMDFECNFVAAKIKDLVLNHGYRYRDIAVVGRDIEKYCPHLEDSFKTYEIPYFSDFRSSVDTRSCVMYVISLLELLISGINIDSFLVFCKNALSPVDFEDVSMLENYVDMWKLSGSDLTKPFYKNPNGFDGEMNEESIEKLKKLNDIREKCITPVLEFKNKTKNAYADDFTKEIYSFFKSKGALGKLSELTNELAKTDTALASEQYRAYNVMLSTMSQMSALLSGKKISVSKYLELFKLALHAEDVGSIPHHIDEVMICDAGRSVFENTRAIFAVGMNEGQFPKRYSENSIISDADKRNIKSAGLDVLSTVDIMIENENHYLYCALTSAHDFLQISYQKATIVGEKLFPSKIVEMLKKSFDVEEINLHTVDKCEYVSTIGSAFETLCREYNKNTVLSKTLKAYFEKCTNNDYKKRVEHIDRANFLDNIAISDAAAKKMYQKKMLISPTQVERYHQCPFSHFCEYGLEIKPLKVAEISVLDNGNAIHFVFENLLKNHKDDPLADLSDERISELCENYLNEFLKTLGKEAQEDKRTAFLISHLKKAIIPAAKFVFLELLKSGFTPNDFELEIKYGNDIEPYFIETPDGNSIAVKGKIDRVDLKKENGTTFVRIIDYKTGGKELKLSEVDCGLSLQMLLYLFTICKNGRKHFKSDPIPSGVFYLGAKQNKNRKSTSDKIDDNAYLKAYKMDGILFEPDGGKYSKIADYSKIKNKSEEILKHMADNLRTGKIEINPFYSSNEKNACQYCNYKYVCRFEEGDKHRQASKKEDSENELDS